MMKVTKKPITRSGLSVLPVMLSFLFMRAPKEETIKDTIETIDSPFESGKREIIGIPKRNSPAGKKASAKRRRNRNRPHHYKDPEIDSLLRIYGDHFP